MPKENKIKYAIELTVKNEIMKVQCCYPFSHIRDSMGQAGSSLIVLRLVGRHRVTSILHSSEDAGRLTSFKSIMVIQWLYLEWLKGRCTIYRQFPADKSHLINPSSLGCYWGEQRVSHVAVLQHSDDHPQPREQLLNEWTLYFLVGLLLLWRVFLCVCFCFILLFSTVSISSFITGWFRLFISSWFNFGNLNESGKFLFISFRFSNLMEHWSLKSIFLMYSESLWCLCNVLLSVHSWFCQLGLCLSSG